MEWVEVEFLRSRPILWSGRRWSFLALVVALATLFPGISHGLVTNAALMAMQHQRGLNDSWLNRFDLATHPRVLWQAGLRILDLSSEETYSAALSKWRGAPDWNAAMLVAQAEQARQGGRLTDAVGYAQLALELAPQHTDAAVLAADVLSEQGRWEQAVLYWRIAAAQEPDAAEIRSAYGWALYQAGAIAEARVHLADAFELQPEVWSVVHNYLTLLEAQGPADTYRQALLRAQEVFPSAIVLVRWQGELDLKEGRYDEAELNLGQVLEHRPTWANVAEALGRLYMNTDRPQQASSMYRYAIELEPTIVRYHVGLIRALRAEADEDGEKTHLCRLMTNHPGVYAEVAQRLVINQVDCGARL